MHGIYFTFQMTVNFRVWLSRSFSLKPIVLLRIPIWTLYFNTNHVLFLHERYMFYFPNGSQFSSMAFAFVFFEARRAFEDSAPFCFLFCLHTSSQVKSNLTYTPHKQGGINHIDFGVGFGMLCPPEHVWLGWVSFCREKWVVFCFTLVCCVVRELGWCWLCFFLRYPEWSF